jgi:DNA primase
VFDLFPIQRHDPCVLAIMTAGVSPALVRSLLRWVDTLYLCFDSDPQGIKITADTVRQLSDQFSHVHDISIPRKYGIKDVGALWEKGGDDYVRSVLALPSRLSRVEGTNANPLFRC